jgi:hypothetical protein
MKRVLVLIPMVLAMALSTTGCVSTLFSVATGHGLGWGSGSGSGSYDYDDSIARSNQLQADLSQQGWDEEQQVQQATDAANQASMQATMDASNAAAASAAAAANP